MEKTKVSHILKVSRSSQGYTLTFISEETMIPLSYLEMLEKDDFESFPNKALALGFLRTYANFLGLNEEEISECFQRNVEQSDAQRKNPQGSSLPSFTLASRMSHSTISRDLNKSRLSNLLTRFTFWIISFLCLGVIFVSSMMLYNYLKKNFFHEAQTIEWVDRDFWEGSLTKGQEIKLLSDGISSSLKVVESNNEFLIVSLEEIEYKIPIHQKRLLKVWGSNKENLVLSHLSSENAVSQITLSLLKERSYLVTETTLENRNEMFKNIPFDFSRLSQEQIETSISYDEQKDQPELTILNIYAKRDSLIRYLVNEEEAKEILLKEGENIKLNFQVSLMLWSADPKSLEILYKDHPINIFGDSIVGVGQLIWILNQEGLYQLKFLPL